jgi:hypothetical protein
VSAKPSSGRKTPGGGSIVARRRPPNEGISDDPKSGGPYVMWKGTTYAHIMVPVGPRQKEK